MHKNMYKKGERALRIALNVIGASYEFISASTRGLLTQIISFLILYGLGSSTLRALLALIIIFSLVFNLVTCLFPKLGDKFGKELQKKQIPFRGKTVIAILLSVFPPFISWVGKMVIPSVEGGALYLLTPVHQCIAVAAFAVIFLLSSFFVEAIYVAIKRY